MKYIKEPDKFLEKLKKKEIILEEINFYYFTCKELKTFFNEVLIPFIEYDIYSINEYTYNNIFNIYNKYSDFLINITEIIKNNKNIEEFKIVEFNKLFLYLILNSLEYNKEKEFTKNELYSYFKILNFISNLYFRTANNLLNEINYKIYSPSLKKVFLNLIKRYLEINRNILDKNYLLRQQIYYKHDGFKHLLPFLFLTIVTNLIVLFDMKIENIEIELGISIIDYIETVEKNPFFHFNLTNNKKIYTYLMFFNIFNNKFINLLNTNYNEKILKIYNINILEIYNDLFFNISYSSSTTYKSLKFNQFLILKINYYLKLLKIKNEKKYIFFLENFYNYIYYNITDNIDKEMLYEKGIYYNKYIPFNLIFKTYLLVANIYNEHILNEEIKEKLILKEEKIIFFNNEKLIKYLYLELKKRKNNKYFYLSEKYYNHNDINTLYTFLNISFNYDKFLNYINEIIYSIKFYKISKFKEIVDQLYKKHLITVDFVFYELLKRNYFSTEELLEITTYEDFVKFIKVNKLFTILVIKNMKNPHLKTNKEILEEIIKIYIEEKYDKDIDNALKFLNIGKNFNYLIKI